MKQALKNDLRMCLRRLQAIKLTLSDYMNTLVSTGSATLHLFFLLVGLSGVFLLAVSLTIWMTAQKVWSTIFRKQIGYL